MRERKYIVSYKVSRRGMHKDAKVTGEPFDTCTRLTKGKGEMLQVKGKQRAKA